MSSTGVGLHKKGKTIRISDPADSWQAGDKLPDISLHSKREDNKIEEAEEEEEEEESESESDQPVKNHRYKGKLPNPAQEPITYQLNKVDPSNLFLKSQTFFEIEKQTYQRTNNVKAANSQSRLRWSNTNLIIFWLRIK